MNGEELLALFRQASRTNSGPGALSKDALEALLAPAFDALREASLRRANFEPPYRIEFAARAVSLVPQSGRAVPLDNIPLQRTMDAVKTCLATRWHEAINDVIDELFGLAPNNGPRSAQLNDADREVSAFIQQVRIKFRDGVHLDKRTPYVSLRALGQTLQEFHAGADSEAIALARQVHGAAHCSFGHYREVLGQKPLYRSIVACGAFGGGRLFSSSAACQELAHALETRTTPEAHVALAHANTQYLFRIFENVAAREDDDIVWDAPDRRRQIAKLVEGINRAVQFTGVLPPRTLAHAIFLNHVEDGIKPFVAACVLAHERKIGVHEGAAQLLRTRVERARAARMRLADYKALMLREVERTRQKPCGVRTHDGGALLWSDDLSRRPTLAFHFDAAASRMCCRILFKKGFAQLREQGRTADLAGRAAREIEAQLARRPYALFTVLGGEVALELYARTTQGARQLRRLDAPAFLHRLVCLALRRRDFSLAHAALDALEARGEAMDPRAFEKPEVLACLLKSEADLVGRVLAPRQHPARRVPARWLEKALALQARCEIVETLTQHLDALPSQECVAAFSHYHTTSAALEAFIEYCRLTRAIGEEIDSEPLVRPAFARRNSL